jgi:hypothetical protein
MSYFLQQAKMYVGMHIEAHGSEKFTEKKWRSVVRRGLTRVSYREWAADKTMQELGLRESAPTAPTAPCAPPPPAPLPR